MNKQIFFLLLFSLECSWAQTTTLNVTRDQVNANGLKIPANAVIWGMASSDKGEVIGNTYLDSAWAQGNLKLFSTIQAVGGMPVDTLSGLAMRYNVHFNEIEILLNTYKDIKAVQGRKVKAFSLERNGQSVDFINTKTLEADKTTEGFYEIITPGKLTLAALYKISVRKPNYNVAFEVGSKDTKITMQEDFYVLQNGKAEKIRQNKKGILDIMKDKSNEIEAFLKVNDLDLRERSNLTRVFERYNSL